MERPPSAPGEVISSKKMAALVMYWDDSTSHYGLRGGVRNFFYVWCEQTLISHLSGYPKPPSKECPLLGPLLEPPGPKIDQKRVQIAQKRPKSDFEGSGGPKRLEQRGTKLERGTGHKCWDFQTNWEFGGDPNFGPGAPKKGPNGPKTAKNLTLRALEVWNGWNGVEQSWNELRDIYVGIFRPIGSAG